MTLTLTDDLFTNGVYSVTYGLKKAIFTIIDETYSSGSRNVKIDRMICCVQTFNSENEKIAEVFGCLIVGFGDSNIAVTTDDVTIRGKKMTKDNMASCTVELYE